MSRKLTPRDGRRHTCSACGKWWYCLAEQAGLDCVYPDRLVCLRCAREGTS